jgi:hypothetical protein
MALTSQQTGLLDRSLQSRLFLQGPAGTGKTTAGVHWLKKLLRAGIPAHEILVFVPQRALARPYEAALWDDLSLAQGLVTTMTLGGLARRMVDLFWPAISAQSGVGHPDQPPHFLTLETAQYYMAHTVRPLIEDQHFFESLTISRNRIYSQILDNLNKAAIVGFPMEEIGTRLKAAWVGDIAQLHVYDDVQACAEQFRAFCLANNLLDFSLQVELFKQHLWPTPLCREHLTRTYRHIIVDNIEEDTPLAHDLLREWLPDFDSALVIFDEDAGFRFFLGADVKSAHTLAKALDETVRFDQNLVSSPDVHRLKIGIRNTITQLSGKEDLARIPKDGDPMAALHTPEEQPRFFPAMVDWVATQVRQLIEAGTPPGEIAILAPFMSDVLRFTLGNKLDEMGIPNHAHRPSRALRDEPATQTLLTLAAIAFPAWDQHPKRINLAFALMQAIDGLDLVRAQLLTAKIYDEKAKGFPLRAFEDAPADIRDRVTYLAGGRYDQLRQWLRDAAPEDAETLDFFLNRLFGEVLSQPGFGFHEDLNSANTVANLIESIQKFRWAFGDQLNRSTLSLGKEYVQMVNDGVIAAQYVRDWKQEPSDSVFLAPAYTFLIRNQPVDVQFWLDIGSPAWYQRLDQPLTQPYVLSRNWREGDVWDAEDELAASQDTLLRLSAGLLNRCRQSIYLGMSEMDIRGYENRGLLLRILQQALLDARRGAR